MTYFFLISGIILPPLCKAQLSGYYTVGPANANYQFQGWYPVILTGINGLYLIEIITKDRIYVRKIAVLNE